MISSEPIAVVGAGISGLVTAYALLRAGHDVVVIDRRGSVGGRIQSQMSDGYLLEHGPNAMITPAPAADALVDELGLASERLDRGSQVRQRYLVRDGRVRGLSIDPLRFFSSSFFSLRGRLRMLAEPFIARNASDETVAGFVSRRFGAELLDYVFDPLIGGLYTGRPEDLSIDAIFPHLKRLEREHGSVISGVVKGGSVGDRAFSPRQRTLFSFRSGLAALPRALARTMDGRLVLDTRLERLEPGVGGAMRLHLETGGEASTMIAGRVVLALPAYATARLLAPLDPVASDALAGIPHPPIAVVFLGYERAAVAHPLDGLGVLTPTVEKRGILGCLFSSTLFEGRAPNGHVLLTAYVGGARQPELALLGSETLIELVRNEARDLLGARAEPVLSRVCYWRHGLPQPGLGHAERLAALRGFEERYPGIFLTGNYLGSVSTGACIDAAMATAARVSAHVARQGPLASARTFRRAREG